MYGSYSYGSVEYASRHVKKNIVSQEVEDTLNLDDETVIKGVGKQVVEQFVLTDEIIKNVTKLVTDTVTITDELMKKIKTVASCIKGGAGKLAENFLRGKIKR